MCFVESFVVLFESCTVVSEEMQGRSRAVRHRIDVLFLSGRKLVGVTVCLWLSAVLFACLLLL